MRFLHTSDWHLGHRLFGIERYAEHRRFLAWLREQIASRKVDVVLIAGDIFDSANPPATAQEIWYEFLASVAREQPGCQVVAIGGNHDSAARLDAPMPLVRALDIHLVGGRVRGERLLEPAEMVFEVHDRARTQRAFVAAVPFLRPSDVPVQCELLDDAWPLAIGTAELYREAWHQIARLAQPDEPKIAMGHCFLAGGQVSELSERRIFGGNQHALSVDVFGDPWTYVALGHLHRAQKVSRDTIRYSGSPLPLALDERDYKHQVVVFDTDGASIAAQEYLEVPRVVQLLRVPVRGASSVEEALLNLAALPVVESSGDLPAPFLEVAVVLTQPEPSLRLRLEAQLAGKGYFLARVAVVRESTTSGGAAELSADLDALAPHQVFARLWQSQHDGEIPPELTAAFDELVLQVTGGNEA